MATNKQGTMSFDKLDGLGDEVDGLDTRIDGIDTLIEVIDTQIDGITNDGTISEREVITQSAYDALVTAGTTVATTEYIIVG